MPRDLSAVELGLPLNTVVRVTREGRTYLAVTYDGVNVADKIASYALKNAFRANKALKLEETKNGKTMWRLVPQVEFDKLTRTEAVASVDTPSLNIAGDRTYNSFNTHDELVDFIKSAMGLKPKKLKIPEVAWRFAVRTVLRGMNMLVVGPTGCGKTLLANCLKVALGREDKFFYFNLGSTQDPRSSLIGNTHYDPTKGTHVALSLFAQAIQIPGALILLDEASRVHPEGANILMTVLDYTQRYLRVDEQADSSNATIHVAPGVSFILTANIGSEYTATRTMDRAFLDRCTMLELQPLSEEDELDNLKATYPDVEDKFLVAISKVASKTRIEVKGDTPQVDTIISTRMAEDWAGAVYDGFPFGEAAEVYVYPFFSDAGGASSPRSYMRKVVQQFLPNEYTDKKTVHRGGNVNSAQVPW